eukprot:3711005-Rhodomonas_salina.3
MHQSARRSARMRQARRGGKATPKLGACRPCLRRPDSSCSSTSCVTCERDVEKAEQRHMRRRMQLRSAGGHDRLCQGRAWCRRHYGNRILDLDDELRVGIVNFELTTLLELRRLSIFLCQKLEDV